MTSLSLLALCFLATGFAACALRLAWRLQTGLNELLQRTEELQARLDAVEDQALQAALSADVTESVLVEKGVADEEELEEVRRQFGRAQTGAAAEYLPERDGERH